MTRFEIIKKDAADEKTGEHQAKINSQVATWEQSEVVNNHRQDGYSPQTVKGRPARRRQTIIWPSLSQLTLMFFELPLDPGQRGNYTNKPLTRTIRCTANDTTRECLPNIPE